MKIEKLTEDKIKIILSLEDLATKNVNLKTLLTNSIESQKLVADMLIQAEKEIGFNTTNSKLLIEAIASPNEEFIFTITKFTQEPINNSTYKRKLNVKRKSQNITSDVLIYNFNNFDSFCEFSSYINNISKVNTKNIAKSISLYFYKNIYYLIITDFDLTSTNLKFFTSAISEFSTISHFSKEFYYKILESGKPIFKKNALKKCHDFFG